MRELKADINDNVWIKAQVDEIRITATGVKYKVSLDSVVHVVSEENVEAIPKINEEQRRGPGRPRKTSLDDLVKKCTDGGGK